MWGAAAAASLLALLVVFGSYYAKSFEREHLSALTPLLAQGREVTEEKVLGSIEHLKNQGVALQQRAWERPDLLPIYGSSELVKRIPDKSSVFFQHYPTGFAVFPVGKAGATSLILLQKIAAMGPVVRGRQVAISLSPSWFLAAEVAPRQYAGNFSHQQALAALSNPKLSFPVKQLMARKMIKHPITLEHDALLRFLTTHLAGGSVVDRAMVRLAAPLLRLQMGIHLAQDHAECFTFLHIYRHHVEAAPERAPAQLNWDRLIAEASSIPVPTAEKATHFDPETDGTNYEKLFERMLHTAEEWSDLDLLVRGLAELGVKPLVLCMPPNGTYYENTGVAHDTLLQFSARIREVAGRYGATVDAFEDHDEDVNFLVDHHDHMSAKGWMYYNRDLDEFYHSNSGALVVHARHGHRKRATPN